jgi:hypothetical protein
MAPCRSGVWLVFVWCVGLAEGQVQDSVYYNRDYHNQDSQGNTYVYNDRRYGRPNYPGDGDYNRGYGENDDRYQVSTEFGLPPPTVKEAFRVHPFSEKFVTVVD